MFVPVWLLVVALVSFTGLAAWTFLLATGRNPLPFPDSGSRIFSAPSPDAKNAVVALLPASTSTVLLRSSVESAGFIAAPSASSASLRPGCGRRR